MLLKWSGSIWDRVLSILLIIAISGAVGTLVYTIAKPKVGEKFTEFYILGSGGKASDYPQALMLGDEAEVIVGIVNHEGEETSYRIQIQVNGVRDDEIIAVVLSHEEKWEGRASFTPKHVGNDQKVEFFLYKGEEIEPSLEPLHLWIDVIL